MNDDSNEEDAVIQELEVFLTKDLCKSLCVMQYPTMHKKRVFSAEQIHLARVKPIHKKLELEVTMDKSSPNFDHGRGRNSTMDASASTCLTELSCDTSVLDTQVFSSRCAPQVGKRFCAGLIIDGQVHVTPIASVFQLHPSFKHLDEAERIAMKTAKMKMQEETGNSSQDEVEEAKSVTVRFKGTETEASRAARERSYATYEKRLLQEKWVTSSVHCNDDLFVAQEREHLVWRKACMEDYLHYTGSSELHLSKLHYLKTLIPKYVVSDVDCSTTPHNVLSMTKLKFLPLAEQLKLLMKSAKIMHFTHIMALLPASHSESSIVRSLQTYGVLVQGCWIVKSDLLFPSGTVSPIAGTSAELMCKVRDYILCLFTKHDYLIRKDLTEQVKISDEEVLVILREIAEMRIGVGWHLKLDPDLRFKAKFPEVDERQSMVWAARYKQLTKQLNIDNEYIDEDTGTDILIKHKPKTKKSSLNKSTVVPQKAITSRKKFKILRNTINENAIPRSSSKINSPDATPFENSLQNAEDVHSRLHSNDRETPIFSQKDLIVQDAKTVLQTYKSSPMPFVSPQAVGLSAPYQENDAMGLSSLNPQFITDLRHSITDKFSKLPKTINIENINSTVALVADQLRLQNNQTLLLNSESNIGDSDDFHLPNISNLPSS